MKQGWYGSIDSNSSSVKIRVHPWPTSSPKLRITRVVIHVFVLELGGQFRREVVHLYDHPANAGDEKIVAEHRGDRDAERHDGGDQRARNAGRHRGQIGR